MIGKKKKEKTKKKSTIWTRFISTYKSFCYSLIGKNLKYKPSYEDLRIKIRKADMNYVPEVYISVKIITTIILSIISLIIFTFIFQIIIQSDNWLLYVLILTGLTAVISYSYLPLIIRSKIGNRKQQIDREVPYALSNLSILASTGLSPIKIFRHMAAEKDKTALNLEFRKIIFKIDIEGKDIISSLGETARETPSDIFREALWDLGNMIHQGGDLDLYLRQKADATMQLRRDIQKEFIEKLGTYSELYISLVLVGTLFLGIGVFLIDALGSSVGGLNSETLLLFLSYLLIPASVISVNVIVSMAYSKNG